ncbi:protease synthase and sporulation negative regulatory protein PAI 1 [Stachybotrys elegans]|uniref:Protease synthase and sporulation negative regulatory protein PAI 1 n=1 Tax=Stachybotrys elegans TaxID=80388 RepID=A0A8K0SGS7_9HYPO|nr:protease synthase and sporulation negative regulatory protein PAI 1 [Stachybotrys elegans]
MPQLVAMSSSPVHIRNAVPEDIPYIAGIGRRVFSTSFGHTVTPEQLEEYLQSAYSIEAVTRDMENTDKDWIVATDSEDGTIMGFSLLTRGTSEPCLAHLESLIEFQRVYVDMRFQGRGIAMLLMAEMEAIAKKTGYKNIWLGVWEENRRAQRVYGKMGFKVVGDHMFDVGGDIQRDLVMLKTIESLA